MRLLPLPLLQGDVSLETVLASSNDDMLLELSYPEKQKNFFNYLLNHKYDVENIVRYHLGLKKNNNVVCFVGPVDEWICGNFNVCIPVYIDDGSSVVVEVSGKRRKRVLVRIALPYKLGEGEGEEETKEYKGNVEEKLRCEAASHIWINEKCPLVPTPYLWGFGFAGGQCFTAVERLGLTSRLFWYLKRAALRVLRYPLPCAYVKRRYETDLDVGYLVMEYIEPTHGKLLSTCWTDKSHAREQRMSFLRDLSRVMLSLAQYPFPKIGSLTITDSGFIQLCNRPLTFRLQQLENKGIPTGIDRSNTYLSTDSYLADLLSCHDSRIKHQANSIRNEADGKRQLSVLAAMRAVMPRFVSPDHRHGPFVFTLTDIHPNNVFVDENWWITCIIDLEWACVRPIDMVLPPVWLTGRKVDELPEGQYLDEYKTILDEFFDCFAMEEEEGRLNSDFASKSNPSSRKNLGVQSMRESWDSGRFWYFHALDNPKVMERLFFQHIKPRYGGELGNDEEMYMSWESDALEKFMRSKMTDARAYRARLYRAFGSGSGSEFESEYGSKSKIAVKGRNENENYSEYSVSLYNS